MLKTLSDKLNLYQSIIFHPLVILGVALAATLIFALAIIIRFEGGTRMSILTYSVPMGVPFIAYLFDRAKRWTDIHWVIDVPLVILALSRAFVSIPLISGHALFLTYALLTVRLRTARLTALVMLIYVICLKWLVWHDITLFGGMLLGAIAAYIDYKRPYRRTQCRFFS